MEFKQNVIEALQYYVYCLVDPRNKKIFYIGKGVGNRVFNHAADAALYLLSRVFDGQKVQDCAHDWEI